jgi:hypothetical protein
MVRAPTPGSANTIVPTSSWPSALSAASSGTLYCEALVQPLAVQAQKKQMAAFPQSTGSVQALDIAQPSVGLPLM